MPVVLHFIHALCKSNLRQHAYQTAAKYIIGSYFVQKEHTVFASKTFRNRSNEDLVIEGF